MAQRYKFAQDSSNLCPRCNEALETFEHIIQCTESHDTTMNAWQTLQKEVVAPRMCHALFSKFEEGLTSWMSKTDVQWKGDIPSIEDKVGNLIYLAYTDQTRIGWNQAIRGRISKRWGQAHHAYTFERYNMAQTTPNAWIAKLIYQLWQFSIARWITRNEYLHGKTDEEKIVRKNIEVDTIIWHMFLHEQEKVLPIDQHLFDIPMAQRLQYTVDQKRLWTECVDIDIATEAWTSHATENLGNNENKVSRSTSTNTQGTNAEHNGSTTYEGRRPRVRLRY